MPCSPSTRPKSRTECIAKSCAPPSFNEGMIRYRMIPIIDRSLERENVRRVSPYLDPAISLTVQDPPRPKRSSLATKMASNRTIQTLQSRGINEPPENKVQKKPHLLHGTHPSVSRTFKEDVTPPFLDPKKFHPSVPSEQKRKEKKRQLPQIALASSNAGPQPSKCQ